MIEVYNDNLNDENLEGYAYLNISETNFNNISVLQLQDAKKNVEEKDEDRGNIIGNIKFIFDYSAIDF